MSSYISNFIDYIVSIIYGTTENTSDNTGNKIIIVEKPKYNYFKKFNYLY